MKIQAVKGTRDFYPLEMAKRNWITDGWKRVSVRNGFEEYDGPIFEYLQMYQIKSGQEIIEQLFSLTDRGGRDLAIRPEITPTLARMVNQQINSLPRPIKWFSVPRLCRAERPQKGRLREFFQWNIDVIGVDDLVADAEIIFTAIDYLQEVGLTANDIVVKMSSRKMLAAILESIGIGAERRDPVYALLDKRSKLPPDTWLEMLKTLVPEETIREGIVKLMDVKGLGEVSKAIAASDAAKDAIAELEGLFDTLKVMGVGQFCEFDISIIRGLAYYTGPVFEIYDKAGELRAIGGGGRYDNLLGLLGGPAVGATGFGMGDVVLGIVLEEKGLLKEEMLRRKLDYFVAYADEKLRSDALVMTAGLRRKGFKTEFSYKGGNLGKQLKAASASGAARCLIIGQEWMDRKEIVVKDMQSGEQKAVSASEL